MKKVPYTMKNQHKQRADPMKHCQVAGIKICTRCGSTNIKTEDDLITCNDCNAVLCFEHE